VYAMLAETQHRSLSSSGWGRQFCLQPPFQAALWAQPPEPAKSRLKAGCSHEWLPHSVQVNTIALKPAPLFRQPACFTRAFGGIRMHQIVADMRSTA